MKFIGKFVNASKDINGKWLITFTIEDGSIEVIDTIKDKLLTINAVIHNEKRSKNANALLWECIGKIARAKRMDKWLVYLDILKHYGISSYVCVKPEAVEGLKRIWREIEVIGDLEINGKKATQCLCYYGSSTYNVQEFNDLLNCVFAEMDSMGLESPTQTELKRSLEAWNQYCKKKSDATCAEDTDSWKNIM